MTRFSPVPLAFCEATVRKEMIRWLPRLAVLVDRAAAGLDAEGVARTARVFMVARSFSRRSIARAEDFAPIVPLIARAVDGLTEGNLVERVETLMRDMGAVPGLVRLTQDGRPYAVLSAASKFIWTAAPAVGIIIDQRARLCLSRAYPVGRSGSYGDSVHAAPQELCRNLGDGGGQAAR